MKMLLEGFVLLIVWEQCVMKRFTDRTVGQTLLRRTNKLGFSGVV